MRTTEREVPLSSGDTRHIVTVFDDDDMFRRDMRRKPFLETLAVNEARIIRPGGAAWEKMTIWHDGTRWVAEAEALVPKGEKR